MSRAGFVAVLGRPNAGKSTLLNFLCGQSLAWVSHKANATRKRMNFIINHTNAQGELATWLALSHRAVLFSHGIKTCELLSAELGEYEHIDVVESCAGNNNIGRIGYHYGANSSFSTSAKRKRVIQPEEIECLGNNGFIMLDNYTATISKGTLV